ncbi:MAG: GHKL domain-containing protein [Lachnospiraceae bacterium]|nr:GHKL domain-containing protein [Lachnospiraceae bacterium]
MIYEAISLICEITIIILLAQIVSGMKCRYKYSFILILVFVQYMIFGKMLSGLYYDQLLYLPAILIAVFVMIDDTWKKKTEYILIICACWMVLQIIVYLILKFISTNDLGIMLETMVENNYVSLIFVAEIYFIRLSNIYGINDRSKGIKREIIVYLLLAFVGAGLLLCVSVISRASKYVTDREYSVIAIAVAIFTIISLAILIYIIFHIISTNKSTNELYLYQLQLNEQQEIYYKTLLEREDATRKFRHDIVNHLVYIERKALHSGNLEILTYVDKLTDNISEITHSRKSVGNNVVDIMMNYHFSKLDDNVDIEITGSLGEDIPISNVDLNIIFGNLFKNVAEGVGTNDEKEYVKVDFTKGNQYLKCVIENSISMDPAKSRKVEGVNMGYGIGNIKNALIRNNGKINIEKDEDFYRTTIIFDLIKNTNSE